MVTPKEARQARKLERARKESSTSNYKSRKKVEQRNTNLLVTMVSIVCIAIMAWAIYDKKTDQTPDTPPVASATAQPTSQPTAQPTPEAPTAVVASDTSKKPGEAVAYTSAPTIHTEPVACGGTQPANAGETRNTYPGGPSTVMVPGKDYVADIKTSCGVVTVDLLEEQAPLTVNSFTFLGQQHFFDGLEIFRNATSIGALQTGSGTNDAMWGIGYQLPDELRVAKEGYAKGDVAMANAGPHTGGSQFFFVYNDNFKLPPNYATFGFVINGLDVLDKIGAIKATGEQGETPTERVYMESVTIREKTDADKKLVEAADAARVEARKRTNG